jgi:hypothetical protein
MFNSTQTCIAVICAAIGFFATTFETYATKVFYLPKINAVNEGMIFVQCTILFTSWIGAEFWLGEFMGYSRSNLLILGSFVFAVVTLLGK